MFLSFVTYGLLQGTFGFAFDLQHVFGLQEFSCPISIPASCSNKTVIDDICCFEYPGGIMLQTQFWDYIPPKGVSEPDDLVKHLGPLDSFTNHGLWPDNCDGSYAQFCDRQSGIDDVWHLLNDEQFNNAYVPINGTDLLKSMNTYWKSNTGDDESLWIHEYNKHGTCINTLSVDCYKRWGVGGNPKKQAVYDYFRIAMKVFKEKDSYRSLQNAGIVPSTEKTYTKDEIKTALSNGHSGKEVHFLCDRYGALNQVWYFNSLKGSILGEEFVPIGALPKGSNCPSENIKWYPKGHVPTGSRPPSNGKPGVRGVVRVGNGEGFLIKNGHWYIKGTPADYFLIKAPFGNYYLKTRMGYCGVSGSNGMLACNKNVAQAAQFEYDENKGYIGFSGVYDWHATKYPRGNQQVPVYNGLADVNGYNIQLKFVKR